MSVTSLLIKKI